MGAIIGDSWWGAFKTISWMMLVYATGMAIVAVGAVESLNISALYELPRQVICLTLKRISNFL